jgi:Domain of unknown function (DUF932)
MLTNKEHQMNYTQELTAEQIQKAAPSAFAIQPYHAQSSRYAFIPTSQVILGMREAGFVPVTASQSRTRVADKTNFTKHMIRFRSSSDLVAKAVVGNSVLEAVLINSHDGTSAYKLMCGVFRFICSNGMVVADSLLESINIRHTGRVIEEAIEGTRRIFSEAPKVLDVIGKWQGIDLAPQEQFALAEAAHSIRFDEESKVTPEMLLSPRRYDDQGSDLWRTFNRVQENSTKGIRQRTREGRVTARAIRSIDGDVKLNRALWSLAERMAEIKTNS